MNMSTAETSETHDESPEISLNTNDRCARCGAQAYYLVVFDNGFDLLFCKHHYDGNKDKLEEVAVFIHDESHRIN